MARGRHAARSVVPWTVLVALVVLLVAASWSPFQLDPPRRVANELTVGEVWSFEPTSVAQTESAPPWVGAATVADVVEVELEVRSASLDQGGPARMLTVSRDVNEQNLMIGQDGADLAVRVSNGDARLDRVELVVEDVFDSSRWRRIGVRIDADEVRLSVDGRSVAVEALPTPALPRWDPDQRLALGNEISSDRQWVGEIAAAKVRVDGSTTDLLTAGGLRVDETIWRVPLRLTEDASRPLLERSAVIGLHGLLAVVIGALAAFAMPGRSVRTFVVPWFVLVVLVNAAKILFATRHPSLLTAVVQAGGGLVGYLALRRWRPGIGSARGRRAAPGPAGRKGTSVPRRRT